MSDKSSSLRINNMITLHVISTISVLYLLLQLPLALSLRKEKAKGSVKSFKTLGQIAMVNQSLRLVALLFITLDLIITFTVLPIFS